MPVTINGDGSISGLSAGGLPAGSVTDATIAGMASSKLSGALPAISGAALTGLTGGITNIDQWYLSSQQDLTNADPLTGWTRSNNQAFYAVEGSAMTESSGTFTFPSTGIYRIDFFGTFYADAADTNIRLDIATTTDNATFGDVVRQSIFHTASAQFASCHASYIFDVTSTTDKPFHSNVENVSLFSQFYTINYFNRFKNVLKDTAQQVAYTSKEDV